jgi:hypothetical protein
MNPEEGRSHRVEATTGVQQATGCQLLAKEGSKHSSVLWMAGMDQLSDIVTRSAWHGLSEWP